MDDELLAEILVAEKEIHRQINALEEELAKEENALRHELETMLENESRTLQGERETAHCRTEQRAEQEANALLTEARNYAERLKKIDTAELDRILLRHLHRILPDGEQ